LVNNSVVDPDPGSGAFLIPGSGTRIRKPGFKRNPDHGSGMNIQGNFFESFETVFKDENT
jgi:hypothetical protein